MKSKPSKSSSLSNLWKFLNFDSFMKSFKGSVPFPLKFTLSYKIHLLEQCLAKDYETEQNRLWLEACWQETINGQTLFFIESGAESEKEEHTWNQKHC